MTVGEEDPDDDELLDPDGDELDSDEHASSPASETTETEAKSRGVRMASL